MPSVARPPDSTSSVVAIFARSPGLRYVTPVTSAPRRTVEVFPARKPSVV